MQRSNFVSQKGISMFSFSHILFRVINNLLFALLMALTLSACAKVRPPHDTLAPFTSDGCSLFPDGPLSDRFKWCDCCLKHDLAYWQGGSAEERNLADMTLRDCVLVRTNDQNLAEMMYLGARVGGHPAFPTWYRWGYGWSYSRSYQPLSGAERLQVQTRIAAYQKETPAGYCVEKLKTP